MTNFPSKPQKFHTHTALAPLREACAQLAAWSRTRSQPLVLVIGARLDTLCEPALAQALNALLLETQFEPQCLEICIISTDEQVSDASTTEQASLAATLQRHQHINELDTGRENLGLRGAMSQRWWSPMHAAPINRGRRQMVDGRTKDIEHSRQDFPANRCQQGPTTIDYPHPSGQPLSGHQGGTAHQPRIKLFKDLNCDIAIGPGMQQGVNCWH